MSLRAVLFAFSLALGTVSAQSGVEASQNSVPRGAGIGPQFPLGPMPAPNGSISHELAERASDLTCGPESGTCPEGLCCSPHGFCGRGKAYCQAPDCLFDYGSGCDALRRPEGEDTSHVSRPHNGSIPYGFTPIFECIVPKTMALTYDDGPNVYTQDLLDILDAFNAKVTFFVTGINSGKGQIDDPRYPWLNLIMRMYNSGHQIASHTWSHQNLDKISPSQRRDQMINNEMALRNILGAFPTYMRPPYSSCSYRSGCLDDMNDLGYHVTYFNVDTDDYNNDTPHRIQRSKDLFDKAMSKYESTGRPLLAIGHDVHAQTVYNLTGHILRRVYAAGYRAVTLGECLEDPPANWYRSH